MFRSEFERLYNYRRGGQYVYRAYMAERIEIVDPAVDLAAEVYEYLRERRLFSRRAGSESRFYLSVPNPFNENVVIDGDGGFTYEYKYGRDAGLIQEYVKMVPFGREMVGPVVMSRLERQVPLVYAMIRAQMADE